MTISERNKENYHYYKNKADKIKETLDTGVLNEETIIELRALLNLYESNAKDYKVALETYGFRV